MAALSLAGWLRRFPAIHDPSLYGQFQLASGILALTFAASALVRFRGTGLRLPLLLACGFVIIGISLTGSSFVSHGFTEPNAGAALRDPLAWVISRTLLGLLLVAALVAEKRLPSARNTGREIVLALLAVVVFTSILAAAHNLLPSDFVVFPSGIFPRPGNLVPAVLFLIASFGFNARLRRMRSVFDVSLYFGTVLNFACSLAASQSEFRLDPPFALAEFLQAGGFALLVGGAILDNLRLFGEVRQLAVSDPLTGLANYRRLIDVMDTEILRSSRSQRPFALVLFDLDGLKNINDQYGHLVGSRALCRVAAALRLHCRVIDTAARYGGDEFALVLPDTEASAAREVSRRICDRVAADPEPPPVSVSAGVAVHPRDGASIQSLLDVADRELYRDKGRSASQFRASRQQHR
jgi:diguanylate cyclase (GGDEF)-like protein